MGPDSELHLFIIMGEDGILCYNGTQEGLVYLYIIMEVHVR
jgi:hypothetical protein